MIKKNKWKLLFSSIAILLPILAGLYLWNDLPAQMNIHWGADSNADGQGSKAFAVFGLPLILLAAHWFCILFTVLDKKNKDQNNKVVGMVFWIIPILSLFVNGVVYYSALGYTVSIGAAPLFIIGFLFLILGNYMPKCKQNNTIGIKIKWTLESEENWNATHRMAGKLWFVAGLIFMLTIFLPLKYIPWILLLVLPVVVIVPMIFSYRFYKKQQKEGFGIITPLPKNKLNTAIGVVMTILIAAFVGVFMFTGNVEIIYNDTSFTIEASYHSDLTVEYDVIDSIEYSEDFEAGVRTYGFGSPRLSLGTFENDEIGAYTRYTYTGCDSCVVISAEDKILVINGKNEESTKKIYEELMERI